MTMTIHGREISRVVIVDDEPAAREAYGYPVEELRLEPILVPGPVGTTQSFIARMKPSDVIVCDYHLKKHSYASCNGDVLVAECFKAGIPGMLCTTFTDVDVTIRRDCLRYIPALVKTNSLEPDAFIDGWRDCVSEMSGTFRPGRRPWRTLVRIADVDDQGGYFHAVVPAWSPRQKVRLYCDSVPEDIRGLLRPDKRFHALVNTGAESDEDLFFDSWESK